MTVQCIPSGVRFDRLWTSGHTNIRPSDSTLILHNKYNFPFVSALLYSVPPYPESGLSTIVSSFTCITKIDSQSILQYHIFIYISHFSYSHLVLQMNFFSVFMFLYYAVITVTFCFNFAFLLLNLSFFISLRYSLFT